MDLVPREQSFYLTFAPSNGTFTRMHAPSTTLSVARHGDHERLTVPGFGPLDAAIRLELDGQAAVLQPVAADAYAAPGIRFEIHWRSVPSGHCVTLSLDLDAPRTVTFCGLDFGPLALTAGDIFFGSIPGFLEKDGAKPALTAQAESQSAAMFGLLVRPGASALLAGIAAPHDDASAFSLANDAFRAGFRPNRLLAGRHEFTLFLAAHPDPLELLQAYGSHLAPFGRAGGPIPTGWNSWDFYGGAITMADIDAEMAALEQLAFRPGLAYLTLDMGWEEGWGQWTPNRRFPETFAAIAGAIRKAGWRPGVWTAPLQVSMFAPLARHRQHLFLHNAEGGLIVDQDSPVGPVVLLDFSLPEVQALVGGWFAAMREAGFELFKVDYLYESYLAKAAHCARRDGKIAFARRLFQTIRQAVGNDAHILNCGGSKEAALGLVDSSRVTMDIHNFWGHIRNNARQLANAFWMNRRLWINDPDFAIARHSGNCAARFRNMPYTPQPLAATGPFWMRGPEASADELRLWLSLVRLNAGSIALSDSIAALSAEGRAELGRLFPPLDTPAVPLDLFQRSHPGVWWSPDQRRPTLGLFNWDDEARTLELPPAVAGPLRGRNFWTGDTVRLTGAVELKARSGVLLEL